MPKNSVKQLLQNLTEILQEMDEYRKKYQQHVDQVHPDNREGAWNLLDYLAFRRRDRTGIQVQLNRWGLSSLGRSEAAIRKQILQVQNILRGLTGERDAISQLQKLNPAAEGRAMLQAKAQQLFGANRHRRSSRVMVTLPNSAAHDTELIDQLLRSGMDIARINCAHDAETIWRAMANNVREQSKKLNLPCLIACDLAGPKLRTGDMPAGPRTLKAKPAKNLRGEVVRPIKVCLHPHRIDPPPAVADLFVPIYCDTFANLKPLNKMRMRDARNKKRKAQVLSQNPESIVLALDATTYFETGQQLVLKGQEFSIKLTVADLPQQENHLTIAVGDHLRIVADGRVATPAVKDDDGKILHPATLSCATDDVLAAVQTGHTIKIDDGLFTAKVIAKEDAGLVACVERAPRGSGKLKAEKGVNFPDTELPLTGFTEQDRRDLTCAVAIADIVNLSFVNESQDVMRLLHALEEEKANNTGVILKIETKKGVDNLPDLLLAAMQWPRIGVMIARGDLGVEVGWQNVAQLQEEILWLSTAAHIPSVWATQVLESLAKNGTPTRAEITDAAMAQRAECVMLNKGPFVHEAVEMLNSIIKTMDTQQEKKSALLPPIRIAALHE